MHFHNYGFLFLILETFVELLLQIIIKKQRLFFVKRIFTSGILFLCHLNSFKYPSLFKTSDDRFCCFRYPYISTIHFACRGFKSLSFNETLTSPGAFPFINCLLTLSAYHSLNLLETYFFAFWLIVKSSG